MSAYETIQEKHTNTQNMKSKGQNKKRIRAIKREFLFLYFLEMILHEHFWTYEVQFERKNKKEKRPRQMYNLKCCINTFLQQASKIKSWSLDVGGCE